MGVKGGTGRSRLCLRGGNCFAVVVTIHFSGHGYECSGSFVVILGFRVIMSPRLFYIKNWCPKFLRTLIEYRLLTSIEDRVFTKRWSSSNTVSVEGRKPTLTKDP